MGPLGGRGVWLVWGLALAVAVPARGQDDWSLTRPGPSRPATGGGKRPAGRPATGRPPAARRPPPAVRRPPRPAARTELSAAERIARYEETLTRQPEDTFAFERWTELVIERDGSLEAVTERYRQRLSAAPDDVSVRFVWARLLAAARRDAQAADLLAEVRRARPQWAAASLLHAHVLLRLGRTVDARAAYRDVAEGGGDAELRRAALEELARLDLEAGDVPAARRRFESLAKLDGGTIYAAGGLARALAARGQHREAAEEYTRLARQRRGDRRASGPLQRDAAREWLEAGVPDRAVELAAGALSGAPEGSALSRELYDVLTDAHRQQDTLAVWAEELARRAQRHVDLSARLAAVWDELGERDRAVQAYQRAIARSPRDPELRLALARLLARSGELDAVIREYEALVGIAPDRPAFLVRLAELLVQVGRVQRARELVAQAGRRRPKDALLHRELAELYVRWGRMDEARQELERLTRIEPREAAHWIALGAQRLDQGDEAGADQAWSRLLELPGDKAQAHATLAGVLADHDRLQAALGHIQQARKLRPEELELERQYASLLERVGRLAEAEAVWRWVLGADSADRAARQEARQHLVVLWKRSGALDERMAALARRFAGEQADLEAGRTLAQALSRGGNARLPDAAAALERIVALDPADVDSLRALENVYARLGQHVEALAILERLVEMDAARAQVYLRRAVEVALTAYLDDRALGYAERAVALDPSQASSHRLLGDLFRGQQQLAQAADAYREALRLDPSHDETSLALAEVALARGDAAEADEAFFAVVAGSDDDDLVALAARQWLQIHVGANTLAQLEQRLHLLAVARSHRPVFRRALVEVYVAWLGPAVRRVYAGRARTEDTERLHSVGRRAIKPLVEALGDADPDQRVAALELLGALGNDNAVESLLTLAENGLDGAERGQALIAVGLLGLPAAVPRLLQIAQGAERRLRPLAAWAVAVTPDAATTSRLVELLSAADAPVRMFAALGLGYTRSGVAIPRLVELAEQERHADVRAAALWALAALDIPDERDVLVAGLGGPPQVADAALAALGDDRAALAAGLLVQARAQRTRALRLLAGGPLGPILTHLQVPRWPFAADAYLERLAEQVLPGGRVPDLASAVGPVAEAAGTALEEGRAPARAALALLEGRPKGLALGELSRGLSGWEQGACRQAVAALDKLGRQLAGPLAVASASHDEALASRAALLLARAGAQAQVGTLERALTSDRALRLGLLRAMADSHGVPAKLRGSVWRIAQSDPSWAVRRSALLALGAPRERQEIERLEQLFREEHFAEIRAVAVRTALAAPPDWSRGLLQLAVKDPESEVASLAERALTASGREEGSVAGAGAECMSPN